MSFSGSLNNALLSQRKKCALRTCNEYTPPKRHSSRQKFLRSKDTELQIFGVIEERNIMQFYFFDVESREINTLACVSQKTKHERKSE
jgi:hypothetical protein